MGDVAPEAETRDEAEEAMLVERVHKDGNDFSFGDVGVAAPLELAGVGHVRPKTRFGVDVLCYGAKICTRIRRVAREGLHVNFLFILIAWEEVPEESFGLPFTRVLEFHPNVHTPGTGQCRI